MRRSRTVRPKGSINGLVVRPLTPPILGRKAAAQAGEGQAFGPVPDCVESGRCARSRGDHFRPDVERDELAGQKGPSSMVVTVSPAPTPSPSGIRASALPRAMAESWCEP